MSLLLRKDIFWIVLTYFLLFLYLGRFDENIVIKVFPTLLLSFSTVFYYSKNASLKKKGAYSADIPKLFYLLLAILTIAIARTNNPTAKSLAIINNLVVFVMFACFSFQAFKYVRIKYNNSLRVYHAIIVFPFFIFASVNILCWLLGLQGTETEGAAATQSVIAGALGFHLNRVKFFFANGVNSYSTVIGALLVIQLVYCFVLKNKGLFNYLVLFVFVLTSVVTDSRAALGYSIAIMGIMFLMRNLKKAPLLKYLPFILILGPLVLVSLFPILAKSEFFSSVSRSKEDFATGNSRFLIWGFAITEFFVFKPIQILGYGLFGHFGSGASLLWSSFFGNYEDAEVVHPHNTVLSVLFDYGYLGLFVLMFYLFQIAKRMCALWTLDRNLTIFFFSFFFYFVMICITESFFGFYYLDSIYLIFMFFFVANNINIKDYANKA